MPRYEVVSGEVDGTNGHSPKKKNVFALTPIRAARSAHVIAGGKKIVKVVFVGGDDEAKWWIFEATTDRNTSFAIHVQELWWLERWYHFLKKK